MDEQTNKLQQLKDSIVSGNVPQLVLAMISLALDQRASDIHVQPERNTVRIRNRVDGVLRTIVEYPTNMHPAVVSRVKIMSNLRIDEQRIPQDGRTQVQTKEGREMDLRVSSFPTVNGEKVVMRIQDKSRKIPTLEELGVSGNSLDFLRKGLDAPNGIILTTGPTGSGKTTTLYSCLQILNDPQYNILTIEDPVEIQLSGLSQSQVHPDINYTFAFGMRTALRQDPDIVMVGEIRDKETIDVAIEASLTGHLVLSTIHTNSAVETLTRISNMEVPNYLMADTIITIIAQRLVRKICEKCKEPFVPEEKHMVRAKKAIETLHPTEKQRYPAELFTNLQFFHGKGCEACGEVGYIGRLGLFEVLWMSKEIRRMILENSSSMEIEKEAMKEGMVTLEQVGVLKSLQGLTTLDEVYAVARASE